MSRPHTVRFSELDRNGNTTLIRELPESSIRACRFAIFDPVHYRADGTCRCDDAVHRKEMRAWGYKAADFKGIEVRK